MYFLWKFGEVIVLMQTAKRKVENKSPGGSEMI